LIEALRGLTGTLPADASANCCALWHFGHAFREGRASFRKSLKTLNQLYERGEISPSAQSYSVLLRLFVGNLTKLSASLFMANQLSFVC
jgi:hypothetical protein